MKLAITYVVVAAFLAPSMTIAAPFCDDLSIRDNLPSKFQKRGPFYSDAEAGWIVGDDQTRADFEVSAEAKHLMSKIRAEFETQGVQLSVMVAPPRPLFVPADVRANMGKLAKLDAEAATTAFSAYIDALNEVGLKAPNLLVIAKTAVRPFYFQRDTHWTPYGASLSAAALAQTVGFAAADAAEPAYSANYDEKGSLSMVAEATCGSRPEIETVVAPEYAKAGTAMSLLSDDADTSPSLALVGTSFSNRYQRDAYRVADAIAHFTGALVENFSVSGGGVTGAMEAFIRSGGVSSDRFQTVVWEAPYTEPLNNVSALRQILGALISQRGHRGEAEAVELSDKWVNVKLKTNLASGDALEIEIEGVDAGQLDVEFYDADKNKVRLKLRKSDRVDAALRTNIWAVALGQMDAGPITRVKFRLKGATTATSASIRMLHL